MPLVTVAVLNLRGQTVYTLMDGARDPGYYRLEFNIQTAPIEGCR